MKITKQYLTKIIRESIEEMQEKDVDDTIRMFGGDEEPLGPKKEAPKDKLFFVINDLIELGNVLDRLGVKDNPQVTKLLTRIRKNADEDYERIHGEPWN